MLAFRLEAGQDIQIDGGNETALVVGVAAVHIGPKHTWRYLLEVDLAAAGVKLWSDCVVAEHFGCIAHETGYN